MAEAVIWEAAHHGRVTVRIIHGASTTDRDGRNRTIKTALYDLIEDHQPDPVASAFRTEGAVLLAIVPDPRPVTGRITLPDLR